MTTEMTKQALRQSARQGRDALVAGETGLTVASELAVHAADVLELSQKPSPTISAYIAIGSELDPSQLMENLTKLGATMALPVMTAKAAPLEFRVWQPGLPLVERIWGLREPGPECPVVEPDILLVPLLLVDTAGNRLGYGGGFYDRTLQKLRRQKSLTAIALAYPSQVVDAVPYEAYDEPLDYLLTPSGLKKF